MRLTSFAVFALLSLSGCATAPVCETFQAAPDEPTLETRRAAHYLNVLREKKNRFWESQGIEESYQPEVASAAAPSSQTLAAAARLVTQCDRIAYSDWGASVLYGQSFLGYENYVNTVSHCYSRGG